MPWTVVSQTGRLIGRTAYYASRTRREIAQANLEIAFGRTISIRERNRIARCSLQNFVSTFLLLLWAPRLTPKWFEEMVEFEPEDIKWLRACRDSGRGIIGLSLHYGAWELVGLSLGHLGIPTTVLAQDSGDHAVDSLLSRCRASTGNRLISRKRGAVHLLRALRRGEMAALLIDSNAPRKSKGVWVDFFGLPVFNTPLPGYLALRTQAPLVLGTAYPLPDGRIRVRFYPLEYRLSGESTSDLKQINQISVSFCESLIRRDPQYWNWSYKRWKRRPTAAPDHYPLYSRYRALKEFEFVENAREKNSLHDRAGSELRSQALVERAALE